MSIASIKNEKIKNYKFLTEMYSDPYFPKDLVDKVKEIEISFCQNIESSQPESLDTLYQISDIYIEQINNLQQAFDEADSEIETVARETIGADFHFIALAYGFDTVDHEEIIRFRDW